MNNTVAHFLETFNCNPMNSSYFATLHFMQGFHYFLFFNNIIHQDSFTPYIIFPEITTSTTTVTLSTYFKTLTPSFHLFFACFDFSSCFFTFVSPFFPSYNIYLSKKFSYPPWNSMILSPHFVFPLFSAFESFPQLLFSPLLPLILPWGYSHYTSLLSFTAI